MTASEYDAEFVSAGAELAVNPPLHLVVAPSGVTAHARIVEESAAIRTLRRTLDIVVAVVGLLLAAPFVLVVCLVIKFDSKGPALFRQPRVGRDGEIFTMIKFRTMGTDAEQRQRDLEAHNESVGGVLFKMRVDPRVTRIGRQLRRFNIDEIPQLLNVLRGDMSLVGPRPLPLRDSEILAVRHPHEYRLRLAVRPGITGEWQIRRDKHSDFSRMLQLDMEYLGMRSLRHDGFVAGMTVVTLVKAALVRGSDDE